MKTNLIKKYKWYLFGAIAVVLIMSIGLSFCAWDSQSITSAINGKVAEYNKYPPEWMAKNVGEDFTDSKNFKWLVVDRRTVNNATTMVLMSYYVTERRVYEPTYTNSDYNSSQNNIREYLNSTWYSTIDIDIRKYIVPKLTAYAKDTIFPQYTADLAPTVTPVAPTYNMAWLPSGNEVGIFGNPWRVTEYTHDSKFQYFPRDNITSLQELCPNAMRIAKTQSGEAVVWWTRTGKLSHNVVSIKEDGSFDSSSTHWVTANNYMRPCVQVQFTE